MGSLNGHSHFLSSCLFMDQHLRHRVNMCDNHWVSYTYQVSEQQYCPLHRGYTKPDGLAIKTAKLCTFDTKHNILIKFMNCHRNTTFKCSMFICSGWCKVSVYSQSTSVYIFYPSKGLQVQAQVPWNTLAPSVISRLSA